MQRKDLDEGGRRRGKGSRKEENEEKFKQMDRRDDKREDLKSYLHFLIIETTKEKWNKFDFIKKLSKVK